MDVGMKFLCMIYVYICYLVARICLVCGQYIIP